MHEYRFALSASHFIAGRYEKAIDEAHAPGVRLEERIDDGSYGYCEETGEEIAPEKREKENAEEA